jgi:hypothetical protein
MVKIPIGQHKVAKTLIDSRVPLNLMIRKTFIEMGINLAELTPVQDTFHGFTLEVSGGTGDNKCKEMLTFEVASFDIGYNYILERPFLLKFMVIIYTAHATIKMSGPKDMITIKSDQRDALVCENAALTHARRFGAKAAEEQAAKVAKTHSRNTQSMSPVAKPPNSSTPRSLPVKKGTYATSGSNQPPAD